jgi:hypothetical protein
MFRDRKFEKITERYNMKPTSAILLAAILGLTSLNALAGGSAGHQVTVRVVAPNRFALQAGAGGSETASTPGTEILHFNWNLSYSPKKITVSATDAESGVSLLMQCLDPDGRATGPRVRLDGTEQDLLTALAAGRDGRSMKIWPDVRLRNAAGIEPQTVMYTVTDF